MFEFLTDSTKSQRRV